MTFSVVRSKTCQPGPQCFKLLVNCRQSCRTPVSSDRSITESPVLPYQRLIIDALLFRVVKCVLFALELCLKPAEDLEIACLLRRQLTFMPCLIVSNLCLLFREARTCIGQLALYKASGVFRVLLAGFQVLADE